MEFNNFNLSQAVLSKKNEKIIFCFFFIPCFFVSCKLEDESLFSTKDQYIKIEGYLPLAPNNTWVYETWQANLADDGTYRYESIPWLSQNSIASIEVNQPQNQITYKFAPFGDSLMGGLLGNFNEVIKVDNKYYRNAKINPIETGSEIEFDLGGSIFLSDSAKVGDMLYSHKDSIRTTGLTPVTIIYSYKTYLNGKYKKMPNHLTRVNGIDDHLAEFDSIIKVTDSLTIEKMQMEINSIYVNLKVESLSEDGITTVNQISKAITRQGDLVATPNIVYVAPPLILYDQPPVVIPVNPQPREDGLVIEFKSTQVECATKSTTIINDTFNYKYNLIAKNTPIYIDTYYAKNVGKIKSVTNIDQIQAKVGILENEKDKNGIIKVTTNNEALKDNKGNYLCKGKPGTSTTILNLNALMRGINVSIPFSGGVKTDIIQNLRTYSIRNSLN